MLAGQHNQATLRSLGEHRRTLIKCQEGV